MHKLPINGIGHAAYNVHGIDAALNFYCDKLGFDEMFRLQKKDGSDWIIYLRITDTQYLELFPVSTPTNPGTRYSHLCLEVSDIHQTVKLLVERGVVIRVPPKRGLDGNLQAWIDDPEGNPIELMQMSPESKQTQAVARLKKQ